MNSSFNCVYDEKVTENSFACHARNCNKFQQEFSAFHDIIMSTLENKFQECKNKELLKFLIKNYVHEIDSFEFVPSPSLFNESNEAPGNNYLGISHSTTLVVTCPKCQHYQFERNRNDSFICENCGNQFDRNSMIFRLK